MSTAFSNPAAVPIEPLRVDIPEAARILGVSRSRIYLHIRDGSLRSVKEGGRTLLTMTELRAYVARTDPAAPRMDPAAVKVMAKVHPKHARRRAAAAARSR